MRLIVAVSRAVGDMAQLELSLASWAQMRPMMYLTPKTNKAAKVRTVNAQSEHVAMVGCSATNGMTLASASVGIALGLPGAGTAEETASMVLMAGNLEHVAIAIGHARRHGRVVAQSMVPSGVAVAMPLVSVAGSSLKLLRA